MRTRPLQLAAGFLLLTAFAGAVAPKPQLQPAKQPAAARLALKQRAAVTGAKPAPMPNFASKVTKSVTKSGNWSDPTIWPNSTPPVDGDSVGIPAGMTVVYDVTASPRLNVLDVAGTLDFGQVAKALDLKVTTLVTEMGGTVLGGDCVQNKQLAGTLTITFLDVAPDPTFDPAKFGSGWLSMGTINMCGSNKKTGRALVPGGIAAGVTSFTTATDTTDWNVGDKVLLPYTSFSPVWDEIVTVTAVQNGVVSFTPATIWPHVPPQPTANATTNPPTIPLAVGNLTRRITLQSENPKGTRGHFMLMRPGAGMECGPCTICHASFVNMGRTDKSRPVTDPMVDANGVLIPGTADNPRARYACHSHRTGQNSTLDPNAPIHTWESCVATNDIGVPGVGWGFNNHDSHVYQTDCISFNFFGACDVTERGSELGFKKSGLQVRTVGSGETEDSRDAQQDFGHLGDGIWLAGPGVVCTDNYGYGHRDAFLVVFPGGGRISNPNNLDVLTATYPTAYLSTQPAPNTGLVDAQGNLKTSYVPYFGINQNIGCGSAGDGFRFDWNEAPTQLQLPQSNPTGNVALNSMGGHKLFHLNNFLLTNPVCVGPNFAANSIGVPVIIGYTAAFSIINPHVEGYETGMQWPQGGIKRSVSSGYWANKTDFDASYYPPITIVGAGVQDSITGAPLFGATPFDAMGQRSHYLNNVVVNPSLAAVAISDINELFYPRYYFLPAGQQLYYATQDPAYVPLPATGVTYPAGFPTALVGLTNQQIHDTYGLSPLGALAQKSANADPLVGGGGIIGPAQAPGPFYVLVNPRVSTATTTLQWYDWFNPGAGITTDPAGPITLQPGTNIVTRTLASGQKWTFFPFSAASPTPPTPTATTTTVAAATATSSSAAQNVTLSATITPAVSEGTVTFSVTSGSTVIGAPVTSGTVSGGQASVSYALPAGAAAGSYTVQAAYSGTANYAASTGTGTLTVSVPAPPTNPNAPTIADMQAQVTALQAVISRLQADIAALQNPAMPMRKPAAKANPPARK